MMISMGRVSGVSSCGRSRLKPLLPSTLSTQFERYRSMASKRPDNDLMMNPAWPVEMIHGPGAPIILDDKSVIYNNPFQTVLIQIGRYT